MTETTVLPEHAPGVDAASNGTGSPAETNAMKRTRFLAELTRAMRAAADEARQQTLTQFQTEVARHMDDASRQAESAAGEARARAENDVTGVREWSKTEIARIKQETDDGIARRREQLDVELADQTAGLELELERVQDRLRGFEGEMGAFFERLVLETDPARFATLAEQMPDPPAFEGWRPEITMAMTSPDVAVAHPAPANDVSPVADATMTHEEAHEAPEALAAVDWAAAEADATPVVEAEAAPEPIDGPEAQADAAAKTSKTQVAVFGLVSVASIATFKRLLSRSQGIHSVQVASGPDGEFVFSTTHDADSDVPAAVAAIQGFDVQIQHAGPGVVNARAVDPEAA